MEEIITETLFWKQLQIEVIAALLVLAVLLSLWNLPWLTIWPTFIPTAKKSAGTTSSRFLQKGLCQPVYMRLK